MTRITLDRATIELLHNLSEPLDRSSRPVFDVSSAIHKVNLCFRLGNVATKTPRFLLTS